MGTASYGPALGDGWAILLSSDGKSWWASSTLAFPAVYPTRAYARRVAARMREDWDGAVRVVPVTVTLTRKD